MPQKVKKQVAVLANSTIMTDKKIEEEFEWVPYIWYYVIFKNLIEAWLDFGSKVNIMSQVFSQQLGLKICKTSIRAQKIDGTTLKIYKMVVSTLFMSDKDCRERFFKESFLLADVKTDVVLGIPFLIISNLDIDFQARDL